MKIAVWGHPSREFPAGADSQDEVSAGLGRLREAGITMYFPFVISGGKALFQTKAGETERDLLRPILAAAAELGMQVHPIVGLGGVRGAGEARYRIPGEQSDVPSWAEKWPCPSWGENHEAGAMAVEELLQGYHPPGIHLDYVRYPNSSLINAHPCACERCTDARLKWLGKEVPEPRDLAIPGYTYKELQWRGEFVRSFVESVRGLTDTHGATLSAAVRARYYEDALVEGQDWAEWCRDGLLDYVCPMSYNPCFGRFARFVGSHRRLAGSTRSIWLAGIGRSSSLGVIDAETMGRQIEFAINAGADGVCIFHAAALEDADLAELRRLSA